MDTPLSLIFCELLRRWRQPCLHHGVEKSTCSFPEPCPRFAAHLSRLSLGGPIRTPTCLATPPRRAPTRLSLEELVILELERHLFSMELACLVNLCLAPRGLRGCCFEHVPGEWLSLCPGCREYTHLKDGLLFCKMDLSVYDVLFKDELTLELSCWPGMSSVCPEQQVPNLPRHPLPALNSVSASNWEGKWR